jgi:hypothetical protein
MLIALLFGIRYSLEGADSLEKVNAFMDSAGNAAQNLKDDFISAHSSSEKGGSEDSH